MSTLSEASVSYLIDESVLDKLKSQGLPTDIFKKLQKLVDEKDVFHGGTEFKSKDAFIALLWAEGAGEYQRTILATALPALTCGFECKPDFTLYFPRSTQNDLVEQVLKYYQRDNTPLASRELSYECKLWLWNETKYPTKYFIYRNLEDAKANKHYYGWSISKFFGFRLSKPVANMEAIELFNLFTLLGPGGMHDDNIEYSLDIPSAKLFNLDQNNCYLRAYFEAPVPDEVEDMANDKLKFLNPIIIRNMIAEPVLIEKKVFGRWTRPRLFGI